MRPQAYENEALCALYENMSHALQKRHPARDLLKERESSPWLATVRSLRDVARGPATTWTPEQEHRHDALENLPLARAFLGRLLAHGSVELRDFVIGFTAAENPVEFLERHYLPLWAVTQQWAPLGETVEGATKDISRRDFLKKGACASAATVAALGLAQTVGHTAQAVQALNQGEQGRDNTASAFTPSPVVHPQSTAAAHAGLAGGWGVATGGALWLHSREAQAIARRKMPQLAAELIGTLQVFGRDVENLAAAYAANRINLLHDQQTYGDFIKEARGRLRELLEHPPVPTLQQHELLALSFLHILDLRAGKQEVMKFMRSSGNNASDQAIEPDAREAIHEAIAMMRYFSAAKAGKTPRPIAYALSALDPDFVPRKVASPDVGMRTRPYDDTLDSNTVARLARHLLGLVDDIPLPEAAMRGMER